MSTVFRTLFEASTVKDEELRAVSTRGLAECHELRRATVRGSCVTLHFYRQRNSPVETLLKIYVKNILKVDSIHRLTCFYEL